MHVNSPEEGYSRYCFPQNTKTFSLFRNVAGASVPWNTLWGTVYIFHHVQSCLSDSDPELHLYHMGILAQVFETFRTSKGFKGLAALE